MNIPKYYISEPADYLMHTNDLAHQAFIEIENSILQNCTDASGKFTINASKKNCNGVVPVKEGIYRCLEAYYKWFREKPLAYFEDAQKGAPSMFIRNSVTVLIRLMSDLSLRQATYPLLTDQ